MGRPLKITKSSTVDVGFNNPTSGTYGIVGGNTGISGNQVSTLVKIADNSEATGWIVRQKGASKFLVTDGTNTGVCSLVDLSAGNLTANTMTVTITTAANTTSHLSRFNSKYGIDFTGTKYVLSLTDYSTATVIKSGTAQSTIGLAQVDAS